MLSFTNLVLLAISSTQVLAQNCACGYKDSAGHVWREAIVSTFTQDAGALAAVNADWLISTDLQGQPTGTANIQYVAANYDNSGSVKSAEIFTKKHDILYGSFRMRARVPTVPGVVFGFFTYITDTQEQDIEFLSSDPNYAQHVYYTNQPGQLPNGDVDRNSAKNVVIQGADFTRFGIHRFDWLPGATTYSYEGDNEDGAIITSSTLVTKNVPTLPSEFVLNVWSNGDPAPNADAIATVQYAHLYFNSSSFDVGKFNTACIAAGRIAPCNV
ncbi:concanavalin A-like lectin/glucanase domain-containing protein [Mycena galopus ATCC 62051]|nr:concanavalin A-like lectin/glucanase domain-containing protein [Mycena galopus ATCC 62051]